ncbi:hypothetical protein BDZ89DRAFT_1125662 [Hymenopellis radicata]|nr:hypothetical protein BDZ89DRAFT_1125662 [Hymenopellis radicata]
MKRRLSRSPSPTVTVSTPWAPRKRGRHSIPYTYGPAPSCASVKTSYETPSPKRRHTSKRQRRKVYDKDKGYETDVEFFASKRQQMSFPPKTSAPHPSPTRLFQNSLVRLNIKDDMDLVTALDNLHVSRCAHARNEQPGLNSVLRVLSKMPDDDENMSVIEEPEDVNEKEETQVYGEYRAAEKG